MPSFAMDHLPTRDLTRPRPRPPDAEGADAPRPRLPTSRPSPSFGSGSRAGVRGDGEFDLSCVEIDGLGSNKDDGVSLVIECLEGIQKDASGGNVETVSFARHLRAETSSRSTPRPRKDP